MLNSLKQLKIKQTKIKGKTYWIKPIPQSTYKEGDIKAHIKYIKLLKINLKEYLPKIFLKRENNTLLIYVEHIEGKWLSRDKFRRILNLPINKAFKKGMKQLLEKGYTLDFYGRGKNFIINKRNKIYYVDTRMPLFSKKSNEGNRFEISKKKTLELFK